MLQKGFSLRFPTPARPPSEAVVAALEALCALGALDPDSGALTDKGKQVRNPLPHFFGRKTELDAAF